MFIHHPPPFFYASLEFTALSPGAATAAAFEALAPLLAAPLAPSRLPWDWPLAMERSAPLRVFGGSLREVLGARHGAFPRKSDNQWLFTGKI